MSHLKTMNKIQFILPLPKLQAASLLRSYTEMQDLSLLQLHGCTCRELQLSFAGCISSADLICMTVFMIHFVCMTTQLDLLKAIRLHASFNMWSITFSSSEPRSRVKLKLKKTYKFLLSLWAQPNGNTIPYSGIWTKLWIADFVFLVFVFLVFL